MSTSTPLDPATYVPIAGMPNPIVAQLAHAIFAADSGLGAPTLESERALADADAGTREIYRRRAAAAYTTAARKVFPRAVVENFA